MNTEVRWKQRFENYQKAVDFLHAMVVRLQADTEDEALRAAVIQAFEVAFELAWKTLKDFLQAGGYEPQSPRDALKQAFAAGYISDGHVWIEMLDDRNRSTHLYDEEQMKEMAHSIVDNYQTQLLLLQTFFREKHDQQ